MGILHCICSIPDFLSEEKSIFVKLILEDGEEFMVPFTEHEAEIFRFADKVESYYEECTPKILPNDEIDRNGYIAFWNEWHRRRGK